MKTTTEPTTPKEQALHLLADLADAQAALKTAVAPHEAEAIRIQAAITKATAKEKERIEELEEKLKVLAIEHGPAIFGPDRSSIVENGLRLLVTESEAVELLDDEDNICRRLQRDLHAAKEPHERLALSSLLTIKLAINKRYVLENYDKAPEWFEHYNLGIEEKKNASVKPAPKPRTAKAKTSKKTPAEATPEQEAA
jgi:hypothetical protein